MKTQKKQPVAKLKPVKREKGAGLKKGMCNNLNGRPAGALNKANSSVKKIIADFYIFNKDENKSELENILDELKLSTENELNMEYKIDTSYKYLRFIASFAKDEQDVENDRKINSLFDKFFNIDNSN